MRLLFIVRFVLGVWLVIIVGRETHWSVGVFAALTLIAFETIGRWMQSINDTFRSLDEFGAEMSRQTRANRDAREQRDGR